MEVDTITSQLQLPFKKLTDEECKQFIQEGCCFCCRLQGHMACDCPQKTVCSPGSTTPAMTPHVHTNNASTNNNTKSVNSETTAIIHTTTMLGPKLTKAQQIAAIEESMNDEEHSAYLNSRNMGEGFYNVKL